MKEHDEHHTKKNTSTNIQKIGENPTNESNRDKRWAALNQNRVRGVLHFVKVVIVNCRPNRGDQVQVIVGCTVR